MNSLERSVVGSGVFSEIESPQSPLDTKCLGRVVSCR